MPAASTFSRISLPGCVLLAALLLISGCKKKPVVSPVTSPPAVAPVSSTPAATPIAPETPPPASPEKHTPLTAVTSRIDGTIALQRARTICGLGSRAYGTPGYRQTLAWLRSELTRLGWHTVYQAFDTQTPAGPRTYTNLIATWPADKDKPRASSNRLILTAHYDSRGSEFTNFPAASSGAAGCGIILELADRLATAPDLAARLQFVLFDGEEPVRQISTTDGLSGSRFFLHSLQENRQSANIRALLAFGAVGHNGAKWTIPTLTNSILNQTLQTFIYLQKWEGQITPLERPSWGPHLPALQAGIPATYLNDALYPALATADDTPEWLNAESLRRAALASLQLLQLPPQPAAPATKSN
ncbi:MAG: M28 family peptidase [Chthoniobacterales bacterium]